MRKLARKVTIDAITPMANADTLELAHIKGWQVVVRKGEFKPGDAALYFEIDSALDYDDPRYGFLRDRCAKAWKTAKGCVLKRTIRIRTMTLRGELSQGLLLPLADFPEIAEIPLEEDCAEILKVEHFDELAEKYNAMLGKANCTGEAIGSFPSWLAKSDEERLQNLGDDFVKEHLREPFEITEKKDGTSATYFWAPAESPEEPFGICSRNQRLKETGDSVFVKAARMFGIREKLARFGSSIAIQGEIIGPGVNGNRDRLEVLDFQIYRVFLRNGTIWHAASPATARLVAKVLWLRYVPVLAEFAPLSTAGATVAEILKFAEGTTANGNPREGLVFKSEISGTHFKAVSNAYLLGEGK